MCWCVLGWSSVLTSFTTDGQMDGWADRQSAAEMMKERSDLTDLSNRPLEFAIIRGCIGFQIIRRNSAGIYFSFKRPWTSARENRTLPGPVWVQESRFRQGFTTAEELHFWRLIQWVAGCMTPEGRLGRSGYRVSAWRFNCPLFANTCITAWSAEQCMCFFLFFSVKQVASSFKMISSCQE